MSGQFAIAGFPSTDLVPGPYGEVKYGAGATSAASIPLRLLGVAMKAANNQGTATADLDVSPCNDVTAADALWGVGGQLTRMAQISLLIQGVNFSGAPVAVPNGATQSQLVITVQTAGQSKTGTYSLRLAGQTIQVTIGATDNTSTIATNIAAGINAVARLPMTASASGNLVTVTVITPGAWGNSFIAFQDTTQCVGLAIYVSGPTWLPSTVFALGARAVPTTANGLYFVVTAVAGTHTSGASEPTWPTTIGSTVVDNTGANQITWTAFGQVLTGGGTTFANGAGTENVTNVLGVIQADDYDRICVAQNDATNLGRWKTQIDAQAGPITLLLQHVVAASNGTQSVATSLAQSTLNDQRFQLLWYLNGETAPSEMAAVFAAIRTQNEQTDPDSAYDDRVLPSVAPQSQRQDWPSHAALVAALNNGVTPVTTKNGQAVIVRSITTRSLNGSIPDYSTLDTAEAVVPDFVLKDLLLYWRTVFLPQNPRVAPDPLPAQKPYASGVGYPSLWSSYMLARLKAMESGNLGGTPVPPILVQVDQNLPVSVYDGVAQRIMSAVTVIPAPNQHQIGVSVRQGVPTI